MKKRFSLSQQFLFGEHGDDGRADVDADGIAQLSHGRDLDHLNMILGAQFRRSDP